MLEATPQPRAVAAAVALALATFAFVTTELLPVGLLTVMAADLGRSRSEVGFLVSGYAVVVILASIPLTRLTSHLPRRTVLAGTLAVFTAASVLTAAAPSYELLFAARLVTALAQALFWSVVIPAAAGLFAPVVRGRVVARLQLGTTMAPLLGVPVGTWLGQQVGWRIPFLVLAGVGLLIGSAVLGLMPSEAPDATSASRGAVPDRRRYVVIVLVTSLAAMAAFTFFTYVTPFLLDVTGVAAGALGAFLLLGGLSGAVTAAVLGPLLDRYPYGAVLLPVALLCVTLALLTAAGGVTVAVVVALLLFGTVMTALSSSVGTASLHVAPGATDLAGAGTSTAFNIGIAGGSALGGALVGGVGIEAVAPVALGLAVLALALLPLGLRPSPSAAVGPVGPVA
ncbi:MFS transporter [Spongisporangium articulatum]|uniref:MFS transporter n=1 Tax=Spongisporangium articulatum TaxID=3362603 RepID=A0ABW8AKF3_9ACTN